MSETAPETTNLTLAEKGLIALAAVALAAGISGIGYLGISSLVTGIDEQVKFETAFTTTYDVERTVTTRSDFSVWPHNGGRLVCTKPIMAQIEAKRPVTCTKDSDNSVVTLDAKG